MIYDLCIVGAGMIGSSAAKHATQMNRSVCLVGPEEPKNREGHEIFGAHYDEGRITRSTASDVIWSILSKRSIARYRHIETETGIPFYREVGCLTAGCPSTEFFRNTYDSVKEQSDVELLSNDELNARFRYLSSEKNARGIFETRNAGYINPRLLVKAQQKAAENGGCRIIREIVNSVKATTTTTTTTTTIPDDPLMKVVTDGGREILAKKVLLATGAFTSFRQLLPPDLNIDLTPITQSVIFAELSESDRDKLSNMPSMLIRTENSNKSKILGAAQHFEDYDCYVLPPIKYPDGKVYLKLGHGYDLEKPLTCPAEIQEWFLKTPPDDVENALKTVLHFYFPTLRPVSTYTDTCATVDTPNGRPYIDLVTPQLGLALGDNGCSAKCCDEIGRLAAELVINGTWNDDLPRHKFRMILKQKL